MLAVSAFVFYLSWALVLPFGSGPDEPLRFDVVRFIVQFHRLPIAGEPGLNYGGYGVTYAATPYLPYIFSAALCMLTQFLHLSVAAYKVSRLVSVLSGTVAVLFVSKTARRLFPHSFARYFTPVLFAFIPQFAFICAYTNQDAFMVMLSAVLIYLWTVGIDSGWNTRSVVLTGIFCGLMLLTYLNGYTLILATLLVFVVSCKDRLSWGFVRRLLLCGGVMLVVAGWFFIRNAIIYHGDFLGLSTMTAIAQQRAVVGARPSDTRVMLSQIGGFSGLMFKTGWPVSTFESYWAYLGNMSILMPLPYYLFILALNILAFMGLSTRLLEKLKEGGRALCSCTVPLALAFTGLVAFALGVYYSLYSDYQPQGRYLYPGLVALVLLMVYGFERVFSKKTKTVFYKLIGFAFIVVDIAAYSIQFIHCFN